MTAVKKGAHRASAAVMPGLWGRNHACSLHAHSHTIRPVHDGWHPGLAPAQIPVVGWFPRVCVSGDRPAARMSPFWHYSSIADVQTRLNKASSCLRDGISCRLVSTPDGSHTKNVQEAVVVLDEGEDQMLLRNPVYMRYT